MTDNHRYPALLLDWLTPLYDLFARLFLPEKRLKRELVARACVAPGHRVLDLGAGTGTLAIMIKQIQPNVHITGLDGDAKILAIARDKAAPVRISPSISAMPPRCLIPLSHSTVSCPVWS